MKKKTVYLASLTGVLVLGAVAMASNAGVLQGKFGSPSSYASVCSPTTLFEGNVDGSSDFRAMLKNLSSRGTCFYQISANAYSVSTGSGYSYPMNVAMECNADELGVQYDREDDSYEIECERSYEDFEYAIRANLTLMEDGAYQLGVNSSVTDLNNHLYYSYSLDPESFSVDRISESSY